MGLALGSALARTRSIDWIGYQGRSPDPPPHPLFESDERVGYRSGYGPLPPGANILILAVPDSALHAVAMELAYTGDAPPGCAAFHLSGALSGEVLAPLHGAGYAVGSIHPLQTVADPWSGADRLVGSSFAIAGEPAALNAARRLVNALDGRPIVVPPTLRPLYHAAAVFASNYLLVATGFAIRMFAELGMGEQEAIDAILPLMRGALDNVADLGLSAALTGPIARGDVDTVRLHLARLSPDERLLYSALGKEALRLAQAAGLDQDRARELHDLLAWPDAID